MDWSQYIFGEGGSSACTAIALSIVVDLLKHVQHRSMQSLSQEELQNALVEGVVKYNELNSTGDTRHFSVEELQPLFSDSLVPLNTAQGVTTDKDAFRNLLQSAANYTAAGNYIGIVITKPPETVCIVIPTDTSIPITYQSMRYALFDSHARPQYGFDGAYLLLSDTEGEVIDHLMRLFPGLEGGGGSVYEMMYNMFEATIFSLK